MQLLVSPWTNTFETFARSIDHSALLVSPFITIEPMALLARHVGSRKSIDVKIITNLAVDSMIQGSTNPKALVDFCIAVPSTIVRHLPGLHAKVYVADKREAIITSANLTRGGLSQNYEYGVQITDSLLVRQILEDLDGYGALGAEVSLYELTQLAEVAEDLRERHSHLLASARQHLRGEFQEKAAAAYETLLHLRAKSSQSTNAIFGRTILYLLRHGALSTSQLHPLIQRIHPDLCDDTIDRVIDGVHFGKRWKHMVRNAQQYLKRQRLVNFDGQRWRLTPTTSNPY